MICPDRSKGSVQVPECAVYSFYASTSNDFHCDIAVRPTIFSHRRNLSYGKHDAPKISAMKIIEELEETKEDYTVEQWVILP
jgi:hypothetical protein